MTWIGSRLLGKDGLTNCLVMRRMKRNGPQSKGLGGERAAFLHPSSPDLYSPPLLQAHLQFRLLHHHLG